MIDYFALALSHGLLLIAVLRLLGRDTLDVDPDPAPAAEPIAKSPSPVASRRRRGRRDA